MINTLNSIDPNTALGKIQLAAIATNDITDDLFETMLREHEVPVDPENKGLDELLGIFDLVQKHRPELYKKLESCIEEIKSNR